MLLCQTSAAEKRIRQVFRYKREVVICPNALSKSILNPGECDEVPEPLWSYDNKMKLFCLTRYYPHKKLEAVVDVFREFRSELIDVVAIITIDVGQHRGAAEIVGVDLDPRVKENRQLHCGIQSDLTHVPVQDSYFDIVFSRYVIEHVQNPLAFLKEMHRILKPGGCFIFLRPNKWHYMSMISRLTPQRFHNYYNRLRERNKEDTFPTGYLMNRVSDLRRLFGHTGFKVRDLILRECSPNYLTIAMLLFLFGVAYERLVNSTSLLAGLRVNILGSFTKTIKP